MVTAGLRKDNWQKLMSLKNSDNCVYVGTCIRFQNLQVPSDIFTKLWSKADLKYKKET